MIKFAKNSRFGNLVAIQDTGKKTPQNAKIWLFRCDCGNETEKEARIVKAGRTESCGKCDISRRLRGIKKTDQVKNKRAWLRLNDKLSEGAKKKGLEYGLSPELLESIGRNNCSLCGRSPDHKITGFRHSINRPARMRKEQGLVEGNVQPVCRGCHEYVKDSSIDLLLEFNYRINRHLKGK